MIIHNLPITVEFLGTPESGKTTTIHRLKEVLSKGYRTSINQESAEILPKNFHTGSMEGHFWMKLDTIRRILEKQVSKGDYDVLLIDRGIVDTLFWDYYYGATGMLTAKQISDIKNFFESIGIKYPDLAVFLTTTPEEAIRRRGGEGHLVTLNFLKEYNSLLQLFMQTLECPVFQKDTTNCSKDEVVESILKEFSTL